MEYTHFFAVDLGATSGRTILGSLGEGKMELRELTRFPNHISLSIGRLSFPSSSSSLSELLK